MIIEENNCVGCEYCINCGKRHERIRVCDDCGEYHPVLFYTAGFGAREVCRDCAIAEIVREEKDAVCAKCGDETDGLCDDLCPECYIEQLSVAYRE